ncbi:uncharacterized protein LOC135711222 [Ochlerotatus camptorhynchus]|uniref:uncharacterized protein LOC135711222 n=1 Tax=Ochlerotatus camptorhynchus TaxID=644619 RepID=UPI0031CED7F2
MLHPEQIARLARNQLEDDAKFQEHVKNNNEWPLMKYYTEVKDKAPHVLAAGVAACRDYIRQKGPTLDVPELLKNDEKAAQIRLAGNRFYKEKSYSEALKKYNECICWATTGSEHLAIGFANRSALHYDTGEYELTLVNIMLAKKNNYPERLMPKLLAREASCRERIDKGQSRQSTMCTRFEMTIEKNPKIPCIAKGISMKMLPGYGRSLVAEKNFKTGDVILNEKMIMASVNSGSKFLSCNYCTSDSYHALIPCPHCVSVMYCDEECLKKSLESNHRFECGIVEKLNHISYGHSYIGPRMLFFGLTLFRDDVQEMMDFCAKQEKLITDPFTLDCTEDDPMRDFKTFHRTKVLPIVLGMDYVIRYQAALYYTVFIKHPPVKTLFNSEARRHFMLQCLHDYMRTAFVLTTFQTNDVSYQLHTFASLCNHSCIPNALALSAFGHLKLVVLCPIRKNQQITISYGPLFSENTDGVRARTLETMEITCLCDACNLSKREAWMASYRKPLNIPQNHLTMLSTVINNRDTNSAAKLNALQQFIQRYGSVCPQQDLDQAVQLFREILSALFKGEAHVRYRQIAMRGAST